MYFNKHVDGFYKSESEKRDKRGWDFDINPLDVNHTATSGTYYDYKNPQSVALLNDNLTLHAKWYDYASWAVGGKWGFVSAVLVGVANGIYNLNHRVTNK